MKEEKLFVAEVLGLVAKSKKTGEEYIMQYVQEARIKYDYGLKIIEVSMGEVNTDLFNVVYGINGDNQFDLKGDLPMMNMDGKIVQVLIDAKDVRIVKHKLYTNCNEKTNEKRLVIVFEVSGDMNMKRTNENYRDIDYGKLW